MDSIKCLDKYITDNFTNLLLRKPLFYNSKVGICFEIGYSSVDYSEKRYIESAYVRSIMIFEEIFDPDTDIYIVANSHKLIEDTEDEEQMGDILNIYLKNKMLNSEIGFIKIPYIYQEEDEESLINTFRYCLSCKAKDIDYRRLLKAICNQDMGIEPSFSDEVFFIDKNNHIIYHLYDDRGLDIISNRVSSLDKIYVKYNQWIFDYDREIINSWISKTIWA